MNLRKIVLIALVLVFFISILASCTKAQEDKAADDFINKLFGTTTTSTKKEYVDVDYTINLSVGKTPSHLGSPFMAAYPQAVTLHIYRQKLTLPGPSFVLRLPLCDRIDPIFRDHLYSLI